MVEYFTFFRSFYEAANRLSARDKGALLTAIIEYGLYRREPRLSGMAEAMFILVRPNLDAAARHSQAGKKGGRPKKGKGAQEENEPPAFEEEKSQVLEWEKDIFPDLEKPGSPTGESNREIGIGIGEGIGEGIGVGIGLGMEPGEGKAVLSPAQAPPTRGGTERRGYGEYGWVKLSDSEYGKLCAALGEQEVSRCIRYIDESAQSSQNKNRWKDWGLVVKRCSREGWGKRASPGGNAAKGGNPFLEMLKEESL